jgi:hypothetical protein
MKVGLHIAQGMFIKIRLNRAGWCSGTAEWVLVCTSSSFAVSMATPGMNLDKATLIPSESFPIHYSYINVPLYANKSVVK